MSLSQREAGRAGPPQLAAGCVPGIAAGLPNSAVGQESSQPYPQLDQVPLQVVPRTQCAVSSVKVHPVAPLTSAPLAGNCSTSWKSSLKAPPLQQAPPHPAPTSAGTPETSTPLPAQAPAGVLSRLASEGALGVQTGEAPEGPDGEDVSVASVADGAGLVEDPTDVPLKGHKG